VRLLANKLATRELAEERFAPARRTMFNPSFPRNARLDPSLPGTGSKLRIEIYSHGRILLEFSTPCKWEFSFPGSEKAPNTPPITKTMMSPLPPEMLDLIVDFLHDEPDALKACCLTSKSWVHRTRQHLFAHLEFFSKHHAKTWKEIFSDPSDSPAHYARSLSIHMSRVVTSVSGSVGGWIRTFSGVIRLHVDIHGYGSSKAEISLVPLRGFSPTLKSLRLACGCSVPSSEIFGLVCSFPLLEDLTLLSLSNNSELDRWNIPSTSPKFTGCLDLKMLDGIRPAVRRLLEIPRGLHFSKISVSCPKEDVESMMDLVSECSDTLESLDIYYYPTGARFLSASVIDQYLTTTFGRSRAQHALP